MGLSISERDSVDAACQMGDKVRHDGGGGEEKRGRGDKKEMHSTADRSDGGRPVQRGQVSITGIIQNKHRAEIDDNKGVGENNGASDTSKREDRLNWDEIKGG